MKTTRVLLALFSAMTAATIASAQTIEFVFVSKVVDYQQTSTADPALVSYGIGAFINGTNGDPLTAVFPASPTVAVASTGSQTLITLLPPDMFNNEWKFESVGVADQATLNAAYGSGTYTFQSTSFGSPIVLNLSNADLYPNAPKATITTNTGLGFQWISNALEVNPSLFTTLTVTTNTFGTNFSSTANHLGIFGDNFQTNVGLESFNTTTDSLILNISAATFLGGPSSKSLEIEFNNLIDQLVNTPISGATSISAFSSFTKFNIQVIPEPSTYAAIFGAVALVGVALHRRRRQAA